MKITNYSQAIKYLEGFIGKVRFEITPEFIKKHDPLERMRVLLDLLGNPQENFRSVLVGGTSGKGSTAYLISHILITSGYKTGLTISPHLQKINERIQINGKSISDKEFIKMVGSIVDTIELMKKTKVGAPSYFEILIAMAFTYFAQQKVDIAVIEVGMGGEFDATNTLYPLVAVLTNVSLDHTSVLGRTVQKIAKTKVGIIKGSPHPLNDSSKPSGNTRLVNKNSSASTAVWRSKHGYKETVKSSFRGEARPSSLVVVTGVKQPSVIKIIEDRCKEVGAKLYRLGKDFSTKGGPASGWDFKIKKESLDGSVFDLIDQRDRVKKLNDLTLSLLGGYQVENASLAIETVLQLKKFGFEVSGDHIRQALKTAFFPGRFEVVSVIGSQLSVVGNKTIGYQSVSLETDEPKTGKPEAENRKPKTDNRIRYTLILDGAHNPTKMNAFLTSLRKLFPKERKIFIVGFKFDKDIPKMLKQILKVADSIVITQFHVKTDMSKKASAEALNIKYLLRSRIPLRGKISNLKYRKGVKIITLKNSKMALDRTLNILISQYPNINAIVVVTGSLYLAGEIRQQLFEIASPNKLGSQRHYFML